VCRAQPHVPLRRVEALAICAFTATGHDSPTAVAEWAAGCMQGTLAVLGGRRDPWTGRIRPLSARSFSRVFGRLDVGPPRTAQHPHRPADGFTWPHAAQVLRIRHDSGPNLVTSAFRRAGFASIAYARRYYGRDDQRILLLCGYT